MIYIKQKTSVYSYIGSDDLEFRIGHEITSPLFNDLGLPIFLVKKNEGNLIERIDYNYPDDQLQELINSQVAKIQEDGQLKKSLEFIKFNFDKIKDCITKMDMIEAKLSDSFLHQLIDSLSSSDNIDLLNCQNVQYFSDKGIIQIRNSTQNGTILTKSLAISASKIRVSGQGMTFEYNWGMMIEVSNNGGSTWEELSFSVPTISNSHTFSSSPTGSMKLRMTLVPKAIDPNSPVTGKAYLTSFAILY